MNRDIKEGFKISSVAGVIFLIALTIALYLGFAVTLFAGFTADIQRELLSRELSNSSPGSLERIVLQAYHEVELREDLASLGDDLRELDTQVLQMTLETRVVRRETMSAWWKAFDRFSELGRTIINNRAAFDTGFAQVFLQSVNRISKENETGVDSQSNLHTSHRSSDELPQLSLQEAIPSIKRLYRLLDRPNFVVSSNGYLIKEVKEQTDAIRIAMIAFDKNLAHMELELANTRSVRLQVSQLRDSLQRQVSDLKDEIERIGLEGDYEASSILALFEHPVGYALSYLIQLPTIMLTLLVTVAAGGLGAVVAFTRQRFEPEKGTSSRKDEVAPEKIEQSSKSERHALAPIDESLESSARLLVMSGEGVAAAIAIFLCAEAGMLMVSQGGTDASGQIDISPFLIAFMAFVSGFMAEDAFNRIQIAGKKLFRVEAKD